MADEGRADVTGQDTETTTSRKSPRGTWTLMGPVAAAFAIVTAAAVIAAYRFGEGVVYIGERTISDLNVFEVTGGAALGVLGAIVGVGAAGVGAIMALVTAVLGISLGIVGGAIGLVVAVGVLTGPVLLVAIIGVMIKRRYWPDVI